ncbi:MAG TPA: acyloxyacyl hydrolase [Chitinophagaceae bacterium]|nr:acyloxyacyl hydrolase [Chitinophagaceae bacterium]
MRILILIFCLLPNYSFAQKKNKSNGVSFGMNYYGGKILIHTNKIHLNPPPYSSAFEISYNKQTLGNKDWHHRFGFPEVALNSIFSMNGSKELGNAIAFYPSIKFRILRLNKIEWYYKFGGGIGLASKHWNRTPYSDSMNNIIGSQVNNFTMFQTGIRYSINPKWTAQAGLHFYHLSNAAARSPNYGINTLGVNVGLNYHPKNEVTHFEKQQLKKRKNPLNFNLASSIAFAEDKTPDGPLYPIFTGTASFIKMYKNKNRIMIGSDAIYNTRFRALIRNTFQTNNNEFISTWQYTAFLGHEFLFGRVGFPLIAGAYLNRPLEGKKIYQKLGMNYHFHHPKEGTFKDVYLSLMLKTHLVQAQYAELGLGFFL